MSSALVLGLGNSLSGADAFGPEVVEWLRSAGDLSPSVRLVDAHTDLLAYIDQFAHYDRVVLVDAVVSNTGGGVASYDEETFSRWDDSSPGAHAVSPLTAVRLFRLLRTSGAPAERAVVAGPLNSADIWGPVITLVANVVREDDFHRPPAPNEVAAGAAAVRALISGRVSSQLGQ